MRADLNRSMRWLTMAACTLVVQLSSSGDLFAASSPPISGEVAYLLERLDEPEFEAQRDALRSLEEMGGEAVAGLVSMMQRGDAPRREQAIELLGRLNGAASPARPMLMTALTDPVHQVRRQAAWALGRIGSPDGRTDVAEHEVREALRMAMSDARWDVRADAAWALGKIAAMTPDRRTIASMITALGDSSHHVRWSAIWAFARMGAPAGAAISHLIPLLEDEHSKLRASAALALSRVADAQSVQRLLPLLDKLTTDLDPQVRSRAAAAMNRLRRHRDFAF